MMSETQTAENTPIESFLDLVYTLALTQVTDFVTHHLDWGGVVQGLGLIAAIWWSWACYSWLTGAFPVHSAIKSRILILVATAAIGVTSLAMAEAFGTGAYLFAAAYFVVRLLHVVLSTTASEDAPGHRQSILRMAPGFLGGPALLVLASFMVSPWREVLWIVALAIDYFIPRIRGVEGIRIHAGHFSERYGLFIILALGESIIGFGRVWQDLTLGVALVALFGITLCAGFWWTYFDYVKDAAEQRLDETKGDERSRLARDAYSYVHLAMVTGIIAVSFGLRQAITSTDKPLTLIPATTLCVGVALYLLGLNAFRLNVTGTLKMARIVAAALSCAVLPLVLSIPAVASVGLAATIVLGLVTYETLLPDQFRQKVTQENG